MALLGVLCVLVVLFSVPILIFRTFIMTDAEEDEEMADGDYDVDDDDEDGEYDGDRIVHPEKFGDV